MGKLLKTLLTVLVVLLSVNHANAALTLSLDKKMIPINAFYKGNALKITGTVASGEDVVVKITSPLENESFMVKEKLFHLFWMNKDKVDVSKVNSVYMLYSSADIDGILPVAERNKYSLGYEALHNSVGISGASDKDALFREFIKVKEAGKLYSAPDNKVGNKVILMPLKDGNNSFWLTVKMPYQVPIGRYEVAVYAVKNRSIVQMVSDNVLIEPVGVVREISDIAMNHGGVYGVLAIIIALITGYMVTPVIGIAKRMLLAAIMAPRSIINAVNGQVYPMSALEETDQAKE
ncbi:MAG: TIGR02186 family protein [Nitrospirae bacterium]|nr:TIGR02186 family protein [Nitrospirota bacterium]